MKAAQLTNIREVSLIEQPIPEPAANEVLVRMKAVGICGSDLHYFLHGGLGTFKQKMPMSLGHEPAGIIEQIGPGCNFSIGDRVAIEPLSTCGECNYCFKGLRNLCEKSSFMGSEGAAAGLSEYAVVNVNQLGLLDSSMTYEEGAMLEPLGVAYHSINLANIRLGDKVAVFGAGTIGMLILKAAKMAGARETFLIDKLDYRLQAAHELYSPDHVVNERTTDPISFIKNATNGIGVDLAFDAAGMQKTVHGCFQVAAPGGKVVLVGIPTYDYIEFNPHIARIKELTIINVRRSNQTLDICINLMKKNRVKLRELVTHRYELGEVQQAFETAGEYNDEVVKAMVIFD